MTCGIYSVTHRSTGRRYVGQSANIEARWSAHKCGASNSSIGRAISEYGVDSFEFDVVEVCNPSELDERERRFIKVLNTARPHGFNLDTGGSLGYKVSDEVLQRKSKAMKALFNDPEYRRRNSEHLKYVNASTGLQAKRIARCAAANRKRALGGPVFELRNTQTGEMVTGVQVELREKLNLNKASLCALIHGRMKTLYGWTLTA